MALDIYYPEAEGFLHRIASYPKVILALLHFFENLADLMDATLKLFRPNEAKVLPDTVSSLHSGNVDLPFGDA